MPQTPSPAVRAYEQLAATLRERILSGELREGERLPSEAQLAAQSGVSRSTVREALRILQQAGLIVRASPRVMVVCRESDAPMQREMLHVLRRRNVTFRHLHEVLLLIEPASAALAAERADASDIRELRENLEAQERHVENFPAWNRLDDAFHLALGEISANPALVIARAPISGLLVPTLHRFMTSSSLTRHALRYHWRILGEIEAGDADTAAAVMRRHVNDFAAAWAKAGLDPDLEIADLGDEPPLAASA